MAGIEDEALFEGVIGPRMRIEGELSEGEA